MDPAPTHQDFVKVGRSGAPVAQLRSMHVEIRTGEDRLVGSFGEQAVALWIAHELLDVATHVLLQAFDDDSRLIAEALMSRRAGQSRKR